MTTKIRDDQRQAAGVERPTVVTILIVLTLSLFYRAFGFVQLVDVDELPDGAPESWFVPLLGDGLVGTGAIIVAILLWKRATAGVWLTAVIFHTLAMWDTTAAAVNNGRNPWDASDFADVMWFLFGFTFIVSLVGIYLLSRRDIRRYYDVRS